MAHFALLPPDLNEAARGNAGAENEDDPNENEVVFPPLPIGILREPVRVRAVGRAHGIAII